MKKIIAIVFSLLAYVTFAQQGSTTFSPANDGSTVSSCDEFIIDSGGQGGAGYGNNENTTITFCPPTANDTIYLQFNFFALDLTVGANGGVDTIYVYDGSSTTDPLIGAYVGNGISSSTVFQASATNTSGCITIQFVSNDVGQGNFTAAVTCTAPCADPTAAGEIVNAPATDSIAVCIGDLVDFSDDGSYAEPNFTLVDYEWDFMDGTNANGANVSHAYSNPGEYRVQLYVTDDNGCSNNNLIDLRVYVATKPTFTGFPSDTTLCVGEQVTFVADPQSYPVQWAGFPGSNTIDNGCLYDNLLGQPQNIDLTQTGFAAGATLTNIADLESICLDIEHSFLGDLVVSVECPNGQSVTLHQQGGGGTYLGVPIDITNIDCNDPTTQGTPWEYCFTPTATQTWVAASAGVGTLPAGNYASLNPLTGLVGCPLNGTWSIIVIDNWGADDGMITTFSVNFDASLYPAVNTFEPGIGNDSDSSYWDATSPMIQTVSPDGNTLTTGITQAGTYSYSYYVTDEFGCTNDSTVVVTVDPNPVADAGMDTTICGNSPVQIEGGISGTSTSCDYTLLLEDSFGDSWNGNSVTVTVNGVSTSYTVTNAQNGGDWAEYLISIQHGVPFTLSYNATGSFTYENEITLTDPSGNIVHQDGQNGGTPATQNFSFVGDCYGNIEFAWSPSMYLNDTTVVDPIATVPSQQDIALTVYPVGHPLCATSDTMTIFLETTPDPGNDTTIMLCDYDAPLDLFQFLGPNAEQTNEEWLDTALNVMTMPFDPSVMPSGTYYHVVGANCFDTAEIVVNVITFDITMAPVDITCNSANDGEVTIQDPLAQNYTITGPGGTQTNQTGLFTSLAPGAYQVTVENLNGCTKDTSFALTEPDPLQLTDWPTDTVICEGFTLPVSATGIGGSSAYTYTWLENGANPQTGQNIGVTPTVAPTQYCVELSEACGSPTVTECFTVIFPADIVPAIVPDVTSGCYPVPVTFQNTTQSTDVATVEYDFGDGNVVTENGLQDVSNSYASPGVYTVTVTLTSIYGCTYTEVFPNMIEVFDYPEADITVNPAEASMFNPTFNFSSSASYDANLQWWDFPGSIEGTSTLENPEINYPDLDIGDYQVMLVVENLDGCRDTAYTTVSVLSDVVIYAPTAFTPDGDEYNPTFKVEIMGIDPYDFKMQVFNRWGELVFESNDPDYGWDGTYKGKLAPDGAYVWTIETKDIIDDNKYTWSGQVTIIR